MSARQEILKQYNVNKRGVITDPGKFEGAMLYVPYFSEQEGEFLSDLNDGWGEYAILNKITAADRAEFPELGSSAYILIIEDCQGFVSGQLVANERAANRIRADYEEIEEE